MRNGALIMRMVWLAALTAALMGCGGKIESTSEDGNSDSTVVGSCTYGEIGRVPGIPYGVASSGNTVFVVAAPITGSGATNAEGDLYAVSSAGAVAIAQGTDTNIVAVGNSAAYLQLEPTTEGFLGATTLQTVDDDNAVTQLDAVSDAFVDMSSIATDGKNALNWYRWPNFPSSGQPRSLPSIASTTGLGQPITTASIDPEVLGVGAFVTDGTHYYARFDTTEDGGVIGVLPVNGDPKVVLVQSFSNPAEVFDVDDTMLLFSGNEQNGLIEYFEVPITGGQALFASDVPPSGVRPFLNDHNIYWADETEPGYTRIWELSEIENSIAKVVVTAHGLVFAMAHDSCGIVYTTTDDAGENGIVSRVAY